MKYLMLVVALLSCLFLTGCESFQSNCEEALGGTYYSKSSSSYEYAYVPSKGTFAWVWVYTTVQTCIKDGEVVDQDVTIT